jgi:hypothetical protein
MQLETSNWLVSTRIECTVHDGIRN